MSDQYQIGLQIGHLEERVEALETWRKEASDQMMWDRRIFILVGLYSVGGSALIGADKTSDYLADVLKLLLKIH